MNARARTALVLMYHRVFEPEVDPWRLCVTPNRFSEHLQVLRRHYHPISLRELTRAIRSDSIPDGAVVVSFDDGYVDIFNQAAPIMAKHDVAGTAFVVSRKLGDGPEFWWDELERIFLMPNSLPAVLELRIDARSLRWELGADTAYGRDAFEAHRWWQPWGSAPPTERQATFLSVWETLQRLQPTERDVAMQDLRAWAKVESTPRPSHRTMNKSEIRALANGGLVEIGGHTTSHSALSALAADVQGFEIGQCKRDLEEIVDGRLASFAYPFGRACDYTATSVALVREAGFDCACSNFEGLVRASVDPFQIPRLNVSDWDGDEFSRQLQLAFAG